MDRIYGKCTNAKWQGIKIKYQETTEDAEADANELLEGYDDNIDENQL
jgi:hypothetical protein